jgi:hypothetical protein
VGTVEAAAKRADLGHDPEKWTAVFGANHAQQEDRATNMTRLCLMTAERRVRSPR